MPKIIEIGKYLFKLQLKMSGCFLRHTVEISLSAERLFCRSRSAHMLCSSIWRLICRPIYRNDDTNKTDIIAAATDRCATWPRCRRKCSPLLLFDRYARCYTHTHHANEASTFACDEKPVSHTHHAATMDDKKLIRR